MSAEHTQTPWTWYWREEDGEPNCGIFNERFVGHAYSVARCPRYQKQEQWAADAALICRAVNAHDDLVAALEQAEAVLSIVEPRSDKAEYLRVLGVVRAVLAKSEAQS